MDIDNDPPAAKDFVAVIQVLNDKNITIAELVMVLLTEKQYKKHSMTKDLVENAELILLHILSHSHLPDSAQNMACALVESMYARKVWDLADCHDWHFGAQQAVPEDIEDFKLKEMSKAYAKQAPRLWSLIDTLLKSRK